VEGLFKSEGRTLKEREVVVIFETQIENVHQLWVNCSPISSLPSSHEADLLSAYKSIFEAVIRQIFAKVDLSAASTEKLYEIATMAFSRVPPWPIHGTTGLVFAGYGAQDVFPSFSEIIVDEVICDQLIWWQERKNRVSREEPARVVPFAQNEMVVRFMAGVDPRYQDFLEESLRGIMDGYTKEIFGNLPKGQPSKAARQKIVGAREELLDNYVEQLASIRQENFIDGVVSAVQNLPLNELAEMAESLVRLTSIKRKVSIEMESVSEPIDVAVISPGDGFIWINRKHYFEADRNPQFFVNYNREDHDEGEKEKD
jgi:hypothetical protein